MSQKKDSSEQSSNQGFVTSLLNDKNLANQQIEEKLKRNEGSQKNQRSLGEMGTGGMKMGLGMGGMGLGGSMMGGMGGMGSFGSMMGLGGMGTMGMMGGMGLGGLGGLMGEMGMGGMKGGLGMGGMGLGGSMMGGIGGMGGMGGMGSFGSMMGDMGGMGGMGRMGRQTMSLSSTNRFAKRQRNQMTTKDPTKQGVNDIQSMLQIQAKDEKSQLDKQIQELQLQQQRKKKQLQQQKRKNEQASESQSEDEQEYIQNNVLLDQFISNQEQKIQKDLFQTLNIVTYLCNKYLKSQTEQGKKNIQQYLRNKKQQREQVYVRYQNSFIRLSSKYDPKILIIGSEICQRKYLVYIGCRNFMINALALNISLGQVAQLDKKQSKQKFPEVKIKKYFKSEKVTAIIHKIDGPIFENLINFLVQIAMFKASLKVQGGVNTVFQFQHELLIFKDYAVFCYKRQLNNIIIKNKNVEQKQQKSSEIKKFFDGLKLRQQLKQSIVSLDKQRIQKLLSVKKNSGYKNSMLFQLKQLSHHLKTLYFYKKVITKSQLQQLVDKATKQVQKFNQLKQYQPVQELLIKSFDTSDKMYYYREMVQSLNRIQLREQRQIILQLYKLLKTIPITFYYLLRFIKSIRQSLKQFFSQEQKADESQSVFKNIRQFMIRLMRQQLIQKNSLNEQLAQQLLEYFLAISDENNFTKLEYFILYKTQTTHSYLVKVLQFYLRRKISPITFQTALYNHYIGMLKQFSIEEITDVHIIPKQDIQKQRLLAISIMQQIALCTQKRLYSKLKQSKLYEQYKQLILTYPKDKITAYNDILLILHEIYINNIVEFKSQIGNHVVDRLDLTKNKIFNHLYLRLSFVKDYFFLALFRNTRTSQFIFKVKMVMRYFIPPFAKYGSLLWCGFFEVLFLQKNPFNIEKVLQRTYLKILNESKSDFCPDLIMLLQILGKYPQVQGQHEKFKLQIIFKVLGKFLAYVKQNRQIFQLNENYSVVSLIRIICEVLFPLTRQDIQSQQKLRNKILKQIEELIKQHLDKYPQLYYELEEDQKQLFLYVKIFRITILLCENRKAEVKPILQYLLHEYNTRLNLFFYYIKIKYSLNTQQRKGFKNLIIRNVKTIIDTKMGKPIDGLMKNMLFMTDLADCATSNPTPESLYFIHSFSHFAFTKTGITPTFMVSSTIHSMWKKILQKQDLDKNNRISLMNVILQICKNKKLSQIKISNKYQPDYKDINISTIVNNPYLSYPVVYVLKNHQKLMNNLDRKQTFKFLMVLSWAASIYSQIDECSSQFNTYFLNFYEKYLEQEKGTLNTERQKSKNQRKTFMILKKRSLKQKSKKSWENLLNKAYDIEKNVQDFYTQKIQQTFTIKIRKSDDQISKPFKKLKNKLKKIAQNNTLIIDK